MNRMNPTYRLLRSRTHGSLIAVAEAAEAAAGGRHRRRSLRRLAAMLGGPLVLLPVALVCAAPVGGQVSAGSGQITQTGNATTIQQGSDRLAINWNSFNVGANESVRFNQPNASAIALNRVLGQDSSKILGNLSANGQVFILNPNGVLFGSGAQINVGGLVASTLNLSDSDFMNGNGRYAFTPVAGKAGASVINQGSITANGGYIALLAPQVINQGTLTANGGNVSLAAGTQMSLTLGAHGLLSLSIDQGAVDALAANHNLIQADDGVVLLSSKGQDAVLSGVVNNSGVIQARTVSNQGGAIRLLAQGGTVQADGTLDASASTGGNGGFIETSGDKIKIADSVRITTAAANGKTGTWLIDPNDLIIANIGGDISATTLIGQLASSNVTLNTAMGHTGNGDIFVNDALGWNTANTLSLQAERNINLNAAINAAQGGLTLNAGDTISAPAAVNVKTFMLNGGNWIQNSAALADFSVSDFRISGGSFLRAAGGDGSGGNAWQIADVYGLQGMGSSAALLAGNYRLNNNIDASGTAGWNGGAGFVPVGSGVASFTGNLDGQGHTVSNMTINRAVEDYVGLFGQISGGGNISNIGMIGGSFVGAGYVGPLAGSLLNGNIRNAYASGNASGNAGGSNFIGGLVGVNYQNGSISQSYAGGAVSGGMNVGGLVGWNYGRIDQAYASGNVNGQYGVGGLAGLNDGGQISNVWASGAVSGISGVGGLIGNLQNGGQISNAWANGVVRGASNVGGLAGSNSGANIATINASYWDNQSTGQSASAGGEGRSTQELQGVGITRPTYVGWDFATVWARGTAYPGFRWLQGFNPQPAGTSITDAINAVLTAISGGQSEVAVTARLEELIKTSGQDAMQDILKSKADIEAENARVIKEMTARMQGMLTDSGESASTLSAAGLSALTAIANQLDTLIRDLGKGVVADMKVSMADINARIAAANAKMSGAGNLDLNKVVPLDKTPGAAFDADKTAAQKKLEAAAAANAALKADALAAQRQKLQTVRTSTTDSNAAAEASKSAGSSQVSTAQGHADQAAAAEGSASTATMAAAGQAMRNGVNSATTAIAGSTAALAAVGTQAAALAAMPPARAAGRADAIRPSLRVVLTSAPARDAGTTAPTTQLAQTTSASTAALLNAGIEMQAQLGKMSAIIAALLEGGGAAKP